MIALCAAAPCCSQDYEDASSENEENHCAPMLASSSRSLEPAKPKEIFCPNGHAITKRKTKVRWYQMGTLATSVLCPFCENRIRSQEVRWRCDERCDYSICDDCYHEQIKPVEPERRTKSLQLCPWPVEMEDDIYFTGPWPGAKWAVETACKMKPVPGAPLGMLRMSHCIKLTSQSFSFSILCAKHQWKWRLYPRDAKNKFGTHFNPQGVLGLDNPEKVVVGIGDESKGHQLNFHLIDFDANEKEAICTIYIEIPVSQGSAPGTVKLNTTKKPTLPCRVWYKDEQTEPLLEAGDGYDISRYRGQL